ncbi:MAG: EAL domain-containing protein [Rhodospirillales bacterium]
MAFVRHVFIALAYAVLAAGVALALPIFVPAIPGPVALVLGATVLVAAALLHEVFARQEEGGRISDEIHELRQQNGRIMRELTRAREEATRLQASITDQLARKPAKDWEKEIDTVVAEVRVLQTLVEEITENRRAEQEATARVPAMVGAGNGAPPPRPAAAAPAAPAVPAAAPAPAPSPTAPLKYAPRDLDDSTVLGIIRDGLRSDRVDLFLQPVVSLPQRKRRYFEAFTRIHTPEGLIVAPEQYIALAEREGLVAALDNLLLFRCIQLLRKHQRRAESFGFFCNISPHTIADRTFFRDFVDFMGENSQLAPRLVFEMPQATLFGADEDLAEALRRLSAASFRFSMDQVTNLDIDFAALSARNIRFVKVDARQLVAELEHPTLRFPPQELKRRLAGQGIDLIATKVETEATLRDVLDLEIDYGQGYLFGEPRPGSDTAL